MFRNLRDTLYKYRHYIGVDGIMYLAFVVTLALLFIFFS